jgi:hypothetical protein
MSELINTSANSGFIRRQLLATASAAVLLAYVSAGETALAGEDHPTVWLELGGQMEAVEGSTGPFVEPFMSIPSDAYDPKNFITDQRAARFAVGFEGKATVQPQDSDWSFSAAIRYGRSHASRHTHEQGPSAVNPRNPNIDKCAAPFDDIKTHYAESHMVLDFMAGKDVGLGRFGSRGTSTVNFGIRYAQFAQKSTSTMFARPEVNIYQPGFFAYFSFHNYTMFANAERAFHGIGPSVSWNGSATLIGNADRGEATLDWGINGALLFGRQKAKTSHTSQGYYHPPTYYAYLYYAKTGPFEHHSTRSRSKVVPNVGAFAGLSVKKGAAKVSLGYRADFFFGAVDTGIDARQTKTLGFYGPFATISIGLGG